MKNLQYMDLDDLFNCSKLSTLSLGQNNFSGSIKSGIGNLLNLQRLLLNTNSFTGPIPPEIGSLNKLITLSLSENKFSGHIPPELSKLSLLQGLSLENNVLEGTIPDELTELKGLIRLLLNQNKLVGQIPESISKLEMLSYLDLHGNKLNGSIPRKMGKLDLFLDLSYNQLTGSILGDVIAQFKDMQMYLNLSHNHFVGSVPPELGKLEMIQEIDISNNNLSGVIPRTLSGCRNLFNIDFSGNNISGPIPEEAFIHMDLLQSLNLSRNHLEGEIPEILTGLKHLSSLDLSRNNLNGTIPKGFANLSSLMHLNLSSNQLEGPVPTSGIFAHINASSMMGNPDLCGTKFLRPCIETTHHSLSKKSIPIIAALLSLAFLLLLVFVILILTRRTKLFHSKESVNGESYDPQYSTALALKRYSPKELESATGFFSTDNIIGASSLSTVYKGQLEDSKIVAIKRLNLHHFSANTDKIFKTEASTLSQLRHRNLVKVLGYAWESGKMKALVLEYMENGNLDSIIHDKEVDQSRWTLSERLHVFISIASGLDYLHADYGFPIVHCDLKPSNILLDRDWEAHVSDFGTARILGLHLQDGSTLSSSAALQGTVGYLAPEIAYIRKVTTKVDVFSFGIIIMEFLTRRRPTGLLEEDGVPISLREIAAKALAGGMEQLVKILDPMLTWNVTEDDMDIFTELFRISLCCTFPNPEDRPNMHDVLSTLMKLKAAAAEG
ncbi:putative protein kinase RLK-Pelle-LRR-XII-1 family [Lupinus albus]|uniref:Protein kinase domain-containing protein n=1 Tax=Lupinus albus TaxID=3870 RepID=A0A6A4Q9P1_LUPAL|nr:putative protein kinase RLK-Pelle-LRR-XII-1 family [Lupinus albus]